MSNFFKNFKQRDYQIEILQMLMQLYSMGMHRLLVRAFTGAGKTTGVAAFLPKFFPELMDEGPLIFLSHRREILYHAYTKFCGIYPDKFIGIEMGEMYANGLEDIIFVSVDSLGKLESRRMKKYHRTPKIILCDEGHHVKKDGTWDNILNAFGVGSSGKPYSGGGLHPLVVFLTATPNRADGLTLGHWVDNWKPEHRIDYGIDYGIENGWLVKPDLYDLHLQNAHFSELSYEEQADVICKVKEQYAMGLQTLIFCRKVGISEIVRATMEELKLGRGVGEVYGKTPKEERDRYLEEFHPLKSIESITNHRVLTEGYDNAWIQAVIDADACESSSTFEQKVGRGLRPWSDPYTGVPCIQGHDTVEARLKAIADSPKPSVPYFTTYSTDDLELSPAISLHVMKQDGEEAMPPCMPIIDVIIYEDLEDGEIPPRDWSDLENISLYAQRRDVFTGTVYNEKIHALTPLRWIVDKERQSAYLWIEKSPKNGKPNPLAQKDTPTIWMIRKTDKEWQFINVDVGGWSDAVGRPVKATYQEFGTSPTFSGMMREMEDTLKKWETNAYYYARREAFPRDLAEKKDLKYLKDNQIPYGPKITKQTVAILKDDFRIKRCLSKLGLLPDVSGE